MIKYVFFDLDGTLIDTPQYFWKSNFKILDELSLNYNKKSILERYLKESYGLTSILRELKLDEDSIAKHKERRDKIYLNYIKNDVGYLPFVEETLETLLQQQKEMILVTMSKQRIVDIISQKLGLEKYFTLFITGDLCKKGKPDPEIYNLAIKKANIKDLKNCIVIEDTIKGVFSAKAARLNPILVTNECTTFEKQILSIDFLIKKNMREAKKHILKK